MKRFNLKVHKHKYDIVEHNTDDWGTYWVVNDKVEITSDGVLYWWKDCRGDFPSHYFGLRDVLIEYYNEREELINEIMGVDD